MPDASCELSRGEPRGERASTRHCPHRPGEPLVSGRCLGRSRVCRAGDRRLGGAERGVGRRPEPDRTVAESEPAPRQYVSPEVAAPGRGRWRWPVRAAPAARTGGGTEARLPQPRPAAAVAQFFKDILTARPPVQSPPPTVRPAPAARRALRRRGRTSLSSVFGEEELPGRRPSRPRPEPASW